MGNQYGISEMHITRLLARAHQLGQERFDQIVHVLRREKHRQPRDGRSWRVRGEGEPDMASWGGREVGKKSLEDEWFDSQVMR